MSVPAAFPQTPVTLDGVTKTVAEWCEERGLSLAAVHQRRRRNSWAESLTPAAKRGAGLRRRIDAEYAARGER